MPRCLSRAACGAHIKFFSSHHLFLSSSPKLQCLTKRRYPARMCFNWDSKDPQDIGMSTSGTLSMLWRKLMVLPYMFKKTIFQWFHVCLAFSLLSLKPKKTTSGCIWFPLKTSRNFQVVGLCLCYWKSGAQRSYKYIPSTRWFCFPSWQGNSCWPKTMVRRIHVFGRRFEKPT
jgi:hypothetical protein